MNVFTIGNSTDYQGPYYFDCMRYKPICCERYQAQADQNRWVEATTVGIDGGTLYPSNQAANIQRVTGVSMNINAFRQKISAVRVFLTKAHGNANPNIILSEVDILAKLTSDDQIGTCRMAAYKEMTNAEFNPNNVSGKCGVYRPVLTDPIRHFIKRDWDDQIRDGYDPFIKAIQSICLSPFFIGLCGLGILMIVAILRLLVEWYLMDKDFLRENLFTQVPLLQMRETAEDNSADKYAMWHARAMAGYNKDRRGRDSVARVKSVVMDRFSTARGQHVDLDAELMMALEEEEANERARTAGGRDQVMEMTNLNNQQRGYKPKVSHVNTNAFGSAMGALNTDGTQPNVKAKPIPLPPPRSSSKKKPTVSTGTFSMQTTQPRTTSKWVVGADKKTGRTYYFNKETEQSQWDKPAELKGSKKVSDSASSEESRSASDAPGMRSNSPDFHKV